MKFSSIITAIVSSAVAVSSTPIHKREIGGVRPHSLPYLSLTSI